MKKMNGSKKMLAMLLTLVMLVSMMPAALAEGGTDGMGDEPAAVAAVTLPLPAEPAAGTKPAAYTAGSAEEGFSARGVWSKDGTDMAAEDVFAEGEYVFTVKAAAAEGRSFAESVEVSLGTEKQTIAPADGVLTVTETYLVAAPAKSAAVVAAVDLPAAAAPVKGEKAAAYTAAGEGYSAQGVWMNGSEALAADSVFAPETVYSLLITVTAAEGYGFDETTKLSIDGTETAAALAEGKLSCTVSFPATEAEALSKNIVVGASEKFKTVQEALDFIAAQEDPSGWSIRVLNGEYERFTVNDPVSNLVIEGESRDGVIINTLNDTERGSWDNGGINVWAENISLKNMTVKAGSSPAGWSDAAISTHNGASGGAGHSLTVDSCTVTGSGVKYGIFWDGDRVEVLNCYISGFPNAIEYMLDNYSIPAGATYKISGNTIEGCSFAIHGYMGGNNGGGTLEISSNTISGSAGLRAKLIVQENASNSFTADIKNNTLNQVAVGTVNLTDPGDIKTDILSGNAIGAGTFYVNAIEPGTIDFYASYTAPSGGYGHWELTGKEDIEVDWGKNPAGSKEYIQSLIDKANDEGARTLSITGLPDGQLIKTFTWFKDAVYWVTDPVPEPPVDPVPTPDWKVSRSKTATNLDSNFISGVTLSLPSAEQELASDIVFVLDKSTSADLEDQALEMLSQLKKQISGTGAKVNVGIVIFNKAANVTEFMDLETQYPAIEKAIRQKISSGTNTHAGMLAGKAMLDADTSVDANRKYLIFVSDGITYMYNETPTATAWSFMSDFWRSWAGPDNWNSKHGNDNPPKDWALYLGDILKKVETQGTEYEYPYGGAVVKATPENEAECKNYANSIDKALLLTYQVYAEAAAEGYNCYAMTAKTSSGERYLWGPSFINFLANGREISFDGIKNDILYLVDKGSSVDDYMGYVENDYNMDFVNSATALSIEVGDKLLRAEKTAENKYGFGKSDDGTYAYVLEYIPGNMKDEEHFVWTINVPVSNFEPVQLHYSVKLANPRTAAGSYGQYDADGSKGLEGLYTNNSAVLHPVDSKGVKGADQVFNKPTVSYTVEEKPVEPETTEIVIKKVWKDASNTSHRSRSVEIELLANGRQIEKLTLSAANNWQVKLQVPVCDENGNEYKYSINELTKLDWYDASYSKDGFTVYNMLRTTPKTGDESNLRFWVGILSASGILAGAALTFVIKRRKQN